MPRQEVQDLGGDPGAAGGNEPTVAELRDALARHAHPNGAVPSGIAAQLAEDLGWRGRTMDVLALLSDDSETMGYLAGGRLADEVATWVSVWVDSPLSVEEMRLIVRSRGWDPDPFAVLADAGLLERALVLADGSPRRVGGELAGAWISDELALAGKEEIIQRVEAIIGDDASGD